MALPPGDIHSVGDIHSTFDVGVAVLVVAEPQRDPLPGLQHGRRVQQVVQELVVDLVEGHPDGELDSFLQVVSSALREAVGLQADVVCVCRDKVESCMCVRSCARCNTQNV